ncbi:MAG TPA: hypothetical protein VL099_01820 [Candidatus Binatia bacterium]|nr:hypothetical protein [Candidatus Binatia bacterium]
MAIRKCPACLTTAPMSEVAAHTDDFVCAGCGQHLQVQVSSRVVASALGIAAGYLAVRLSGPADSMLGWAAPALFGLLGYGCVSALATMATADLRVMPAPAPAALAGPSTHGSGHH